MVQPRENLSRLRSFCSIPEIPSLLFLGQAQSPGPRAQGSLDAGADSALGCVTRTTMIGTLARRTQTLITHVTKGFAYHLLCGANWSMHETPTVQHTSLQVISDHLDCRLAG